MTAKTQLNAHWVNISNLCWHYAAANREFSVRDIIDDVLSQNPERERRRIQMSVSQALNRMKSKGQVEPGSRYGQYISKIYDEKAFG